MFSFLKRNKETSNKQNSSSDLPDSSELSESFDDLRSFNAKEFVSSLLSWDVS